MLISLVLSFLGLEDGIIYQQHILVVEPHIVGLTTFVSKGVLEPVFVVALGVVGAVVRAPALGPRQRPVDGSLATIKKETTHDSFNHSRIEGFALTCHLHPRESVCEHLRRVTR